MAVPEPSLSHDDDIAALLRDLPTTVRVADPATGAKPPSGGRPAALTTGAASTATTSGDEIDRLLAEIAPAGAAAGAPTTAAGGSTTRARALAATVMAPVDPLDAVLESMRPAAAVTKSIVKSKAPNPQLGLSQDDLDSLVAKHGAGAPSTASSEAPISQEDIDSLVNQLSSATGTQTGGKAAAGTGKTAAAGGEAASRTTAISAGAAGAAGVVMLPGVPVMAPAELRGTRWLLVAAVALLAVCALVLVVLTTAIRGLSRELRKDIVVTAPVGEDFTADLKTALGFLRSPDEAEAAKGAMFLVQLKERFPNREIELALTLARHYRAHGNQRKAASEYAAIVDRSPGRLGDPGIYLEYADSLYQLDEIDTATRQVYRLLAREQDHRAELDERGRPRAGDEVARDRLAVQQAYLMLGRLLGEDRHTGDAPQAAGHAPAARPAAGHVPAPAEHTAAAPPAGHAAAPRAPATVAAHGGGH